MLQPCDTEKQPGPARIAVTFCLQKQLLRGGASMIRFWVVTNDPRDTWTEKFPASSRAQPSPPFPFLLLLEISLRLSF